jgi:hypothetical protein
MGFIDIPTEQTTALTDLINFFLGIILAVIISRAGHGKDQGRGRYWTIIFLLIGLASGLGALAHGIDMTGEMRRIVWHPLNLSLGITVSLFLTIVVSEVRGPEEAVRGLPILLGLGIAFFVVTLVVPGIFLIFIVFNAMAMILALSGFSYLSVKRGDVFSRRMTVLIIVVILLSVLFAMVKMVGGLEVEFIWKFDQNGIFHIIQTLAMIYLALIIKDRIDNPE